MALSFTGTVYVVVREYEDLFGKHLGVEAVCTHERQANHMCTRLNAEEGEKKRKHEEMYGKGKEEESNWGLYVFSIVESSLREAEEWEEDREE